MRIGVRRSQPAYRAGQQELVVITRQRRDRKTQRRKAPYFHGGQGPLDLLRRLAPPRPVLKIEPDLSRIFFLEPLPAAAARFGVALKNGGHCNGASSLRGRRPCSPELWFR